MSFDLGAFSLEIHEALAFALLALVAGHLAGVVYESWRSSENLARSMVTGAKRVPPDAILGPPDPGRAAMILTGLGLIMIPATYLGLTAPRPEGSGVAQPPSFLSECGDCHGVFHPSLMNRQNWGQVMAGLADHFGEDASLPEGEAREIATYLENHAAETYDTKAARLIGRSGIPADLRITGSAFWTRAHRTIDSAIFKRKPVGQRSNCAACHQDASTGRFAPQLISIPKE